MQEGWHHARRPGLFFGLVLILLGTIFFFSNQGWLPRGDWWKYFLIGLGSIFIIEVLVGYASPTHRRPMPGCLIGGLILISIGLAFTTGVGSWWPLILIATGLAILLNALLRRR